MKPEILAFYNDLNIPVSKMINVGVGRKHLSADSIEAAAVEVYHEIQSGRLVIPQIRIAWEVYSRAKTIKVEGESQERDVVEVMQAQLDEYEREITDLKAQLAEYVESHARRAQLIGELQDQIDEYRNLPWWKRLRGKP